MKYLLIVFAVWELYTCIFYKKMIQRTIYLNYKMKRPGYEWAYKTIKNTWSFRIITTMDKAYSLFVYVIIFLKPFRWCGLAIFFVSMINAFIFMYEDKTGKKLVNRAVFEIFDSICCAIMMLFCFYMLRGV